MLKKSPSKKCLTYIWRDSSNRREDILKRKCFQDLRRDSSFRDNVTPLFFEAVLNARAGERPAGVGRDRHFGPGGVGRDRHFGPAAAGLMVVVVLAPHHNVQHVAGVGLLVGLAGVGGGKR